MNPSQTPLEGRAFPRATAPEVVVFDLGKVLLDFDYGVAAATLAGSCGLNPKQLRDALDQSSLLFTYETGHLTSEQFFGKVCEASGFAGCFENFCASFGDIFSPIAPMIELHARLRAAGRRTYIFSNTNELAIAHIRKTFPFFSHFDGYVLSFEAGSMKPDPKIYQAVEKMTGHSGSQLLYIDDRPENIEAGKARGWRTILHVAPTETIAAVEKLQLIAQH